MILRYTLLYSLLFGITAITAHTLRWLSLPPVSVHQWRQADGASLAWHYAQHPAFSAAQISNLFYTGDAHALGEFPLLYWLAGIISHYLGYPEYPLRWIGLLLLFSGGWAFGWIMLQRAGRPVTAALAAGLLLTSPILGYYGPNFLPDAPAFCFVLMMLAALFQACRRQSPGWLMATAACAALAVLLKLSMAILPVALAVAWLGGMGRRLFGGMAIVLTTATVLAGRWWIGHYNTLHQASYFLAATRPIWNYDWPFIREVLAGLLTFGLPAFMSAGLYLACGGSLVLTVKHWKQTPAFLRQTLVLTALGSLAYALLWFRMLREHDYYLICLLAAPVLLLANGIRLAATRFTAKQLVAVLGICWLLGAGHHHYLLSKRLHLAVHPQSSQNLPPDAFLPVHDLTSKQIPPETRVFCPQDPSPNIALFALKRQGWTAYNFGDRITADTLHKYQTRFGLTHLALRDTAVYTPLYRQFFPKPAGAIQGWYFYRR